MGTVAAFRLGLDSNNWPAQAYNIHNVQIFRHTNIYL